MVSTDNPPQNDPEPVNANRTARSMHDSVRVTDEVTVTRLTVSGWPSATPRGPSGRGRVRTTTTRPCSLASCSST